ncbi:dephospho-CoA kinase [Candidatus Enterococcus murrayae]|uniref:Dephospho-CoA kinase n=1 Tax=Candidatus Enterococcus murrayae TaxID=2815321 RepID=A0ABS3HJ27_9ENTE|nr:dephospho-CoA kinase [Enterococcus sp. MJM16]MBO0453463.1 dephospho-CoA kinase [Enterococcus sp. MJM16]
MSFVLGVTGGIASGKSTVVDFFKAKGFPIVDGDIVARKVVEPETEGLMALKNTFGQTIIDENGQLDRKKLGSIIFHDEKKRALLNKTLDPFIRGEIQRQTEEAKLSSDLVIVDIPLLYEGNYETMMDKVAVVYVTPEIQLNRLMARNHLNEEEAMERIKSQLSLKKKKERADIIIDNCRSREKTRQQVLDWLQKNKFVS